MDYKDVTYTTVQVAKELGVSRDTLLRWFREKKISSVLRDKRGWRIFTIHDIENIKREISFPSSLNETQVKNDIQFELFSSSQDNGAPHQPLRLIQYLGSKLNILSQLVPYLKAATPKDGIFFDLFAGTTCVGQAMLGHSNVITNDSMIYSKYLGDVLILGPTHDDYPLPPIEMLLESKAYKSNKKKLLTIYDNKWLEEKRLIENNDIEGLVDFCENLPTIWKTKSLAVNNEIVDFIKNLRLTNDKESLFIEPACLFTIYYAGTYFGLNQCIEIDSIRYAIHSYEKNGIFSVWQAKAYLCALMSAMSSVVSSAGKHFAQPILTFNKEKAKEFSKKRCLTDRKLDIIDKIKNGIDLLNSCKYVSKKKNHSLMLPFEFIQKEFIDKDKLNSFCRDYLRTPKIDCIYADPPYTAQQYSRFYHILETLCYYDYPTLQSGRYYEGITKGLYRKERHYSCFCRVNPAKAAFYKLIQFTKSLSASLILSYSESKSETGNRRMVTPELFYTIAKKNSMKLEKIILSHNYKPLSNRTNQKKDSREQEQLYIFT